MESKNFDTALAESRGESLQFTLGGREWNIPLPIPAGPLLEMASIIGNEGNEIEAAKALADFMFSIVAADELVDFKTMLRNERVGMNLLDEVSRWAVEESTARPTSNPSELPPS